MFTNRFEYLYVEPSTHCALGCPRCPRTYEKSAYKLKHLDLDLYEKIISSSIFDELKTVEFGGNYGDPIFHPNLKAIVEATKKLRSSSQVIIHTSGNREMRWWEDFAGALDESDTVLFSVDGLRDNNSVYRVNSKWDWIEKAMDTCVGKVNVIWKFIVFKHNQSQINEAIEFAKEKGVNGFILVKSGIFNGMWEKDGVDSLAPEENWIYKPLKGDKLMPKCQSSSRHYISADGFYSPCCWMDFSKEYSIDLNNFLNNNNEFVDAMNDQKLISLKKSWGSSPPITCSGKCSENEESLKRSSHAQLRINLSEDIESISKQVNDFKLQK